MASKHTARNLLAAAFSCVGDDKYGDARKYLERADREVKRLREEGCDDIEPAPKKRLVRKTIGWLRRKPKEQLSEGEEYEKEQKQERTRQKMKFLKKVAVLLMFAGLGGLVATNHEKLALLVPDFDAATRSEFQLADGCTSCGAISERTDEQSAFCTSCGTTGLKEVVAAKLHGAPWGNQVGWQLPDGQVLLFDTETEIEVPPLRVSGKPTLTRF